MRRRRLLGLSGTTTLVCFHLIGNAAKLTTFSASVTFKSLDFESESIYTYSCHI